MIRFTLLTLAGIALSPSGFAADYPPKTIFIDLSVGQPKKMQDWSGSASLSEGELVKVEKTSGSSDAINADGSWMIVYGRSLKGKPNEPARPKSVVLTIKAPGDAVVSVKTQGGDFEFALGEATVRGIERLGGNVRIRLGQPRRRGGNRGGGSAGMKAAVIAGEIPSQRVSDPSKQSDWPAIAMSRDGATWAAWVEWNGKDADRVVLRRKGPVTERWGEAIILDDGCFDHYAPALVGGRDGVAVVWSAQTQAAGNFDLYATEVEAGKPPLKPQRLTTAPNGDFNARVVADAKDNLFVVWQSFREGTSDIYVRTGTADGWGAEIRVSPSLANDWEPKIALDSRGTAWISWDSYANGNYDVFLRSFDGKQLGEVIPITSEPTAQFHSSLALDQQDRVWVAWDEASVNWGLDNSRSSAMEGSQGLHYSRGLGVRCWANGRLVEPKTPIADILTNKMSRYAELPTLAVDGQGTLWMVFRHWTVHKPTEMYDFYVTKLTSDGWVTPWLLANSRGRNSQVADVARAPNGALHAAWSSDLRTPENLPTDQTHSLIYRAYTATLAGVEGGGFPGLAPVELPEPGRPVPRRVRASYSVGGNTYTLMYGDCHRHTDIRGHSSVDGSILDTFRYARDPAQLDFLGLGDHNEVFGGRWPDGLRDYSWWYTQKLVDLFTCAPHFVGLYSYEHSMSRPGGHRNLLFAKRGAPLRHIDRGKGGEVNGVNPGNQPPELWTWAREHVLTQPGQKLVIVPHTFAAGPLADWNWPNAPFDACLEIYQGCRGSYEAYNLPPGQKRGPTQTKDPGHFAQDAFAKGNLYGFVSFSDHQSTHNSWAGVWAAEPTRESIIDAMLARRTFGASDEMTIKMVAGNRAMGEQFEAREPLELKLDVTAPEEILQVDLIKDGQVIWSKQPGGKQLSGTFRDAGLSKGNSYYYVRVLQYDPDPAKITYPDQPDLKDPEMGWGSPVFVTYR